MQLTGYDANARGAVLDLLLAKWEERAKNVAEMATWAAVSNEMIEFKVQRKSGKRSSKIRTLVVNKVPHLAREFP